ncbi:MAG: pyridoxal phosphate-dependent aminotransferase family protein [Gemmataceae bacterium]|nr:pyridoxal phosphate-dependent aminotransferase family protein [Gemmataceae bacterium]MCI0742113.1 pyridoxal phosphate-dependent aminotransferase family protein [Gemmataceae bacterium]
MTTPLRQIVSLLRKKGLSQIFERIALEHASLHMKGLTAEAFGPERTVKIEGRWVTNFGSDSFLGLDQDPRLWSALKRGLEEWGTHNGTSRAFVSAQPNFTAEEKLASWLGTEAAVIYPSVTLANHGAIPALVGRSDVIVTDRFAHNSIFEGVKLASARGARTATFAHNDPDDLARVLTEMEPYRHALIAVDGVYSMSGQLPPLRAFQDIALARRGFLYVDDAHATGVLGSQGRGTVRDALGGYENTVVVGSLSKALSCLGGFVAGDGETMWMLSIHSNVLIFGGPIPPPYLEAICAAVDILDSEEYQSIRSRLDANVQAVLAGVRPLGFVVQGGVTPIISLLIGDETDTLWSGRFLFEQGYYVQSVIFPAVPHHEGVLRIQINANHRPESIAGLLDALRGLRQALSSVRTSIPA